MRNILDILLSFLRALSPKEEIRVVYKSVTKKEDGVAVEAIAEVREENFADSVEISSHKEFATAYPKLNVRSDPFVYEDNKIGWLAYGDSVEVLFVEDGWKKILYAGTQAWVSAHYLTSDEKVVFPTFIVGEGNLHRSPNAIKVRNVIHDEFGGDVGGWELQCTEYVQYKVKRLGIDIIWPPERPRNGGRWAEIFTQYDLYEVTPEPKKFGAVCLRAGLGSKVSNEVGHVAFIEGVLPEGAIRVSEANWPRDGIYNERVISAKDLKNKYKAEFVSFL